ncbi:MAG: hypothetical protein N3F66_09245 [Spirochaetes bacterium]|nr:hypothetical protein [Spirochaetota bacterium]
MKVSIDAILQSAQQLKSTINVDEHKSGNKNKITTDKIHIEHRVMARLDEIHTQIKDIQTNLTRYQVMSDGVGMLLDDIRKGGSNSQNIINSILFNNRPVLKEFLGDSYDENSITYKSEQLKNLIADSISSLQKLEVEFENIVASDLARNVHLKDRINEINALIPRTIKNPQHLHHLDAETVKRLIQ